MTDLGVLDGLTVGVLGGTGAQGRGLALRWAAAGVPVVLGSRDAGRAEVAAAELVELLAEAGFAGARVSGADNAACAARADVVLAAIPWDGHAELLASLADELGGKVLIDCVNPIGFGKTGPFPLEVAEGSAAQQAQAVLPGSRVIGAFHNVSAVVLADLSRVEVDTDVLVMGEDRADVDLVIALADVIPGVRGLFGGRLANCGQVEKLTANLIAINRRHKTHAGIRITGHGL
ncbi:NADPH-dependent F420 reductase [Aeromicrobium sp.]|uniref:NADPH-dependent F420 reductase n=1 Tax=Aeromicrobium sp. TaxID=1871063 RepID=UPI0025B8AD6C|nr:NADPH-dependent F420 reductase [Aeromicrobium sp.]MCK5891439.1 NADPH-dependent F420 reductase [Aeromicrobium sp.]